MNIPTVAVVGSLNIDLVASVPHLPSPGETLAASALATVFGGKGANQAMAAARQGARVHLIGSVGEDAHGPRYRDHLAASGIDVSGIYTRCGLPTGTALIAVDARGENEIIIAEGANGRLSSADVARHAGVLRSAGAVVLQFEVPAPAILAAIRHAADAPIVLNPSPWRADFPWGKFPVSTVVVNETEAVFLLGHRLAGSCDQPSPALFRRLAQLRIDTLVITRGAAPTLVFRDRIALKVPTLQVQPVDTVGAGDTFTGTLATRLAAGDPIATAVRTANCAGALATLRPGAQGATPTAAATRRALHRLPPSETLSSRKPTRRP